MNMDRNQEHMDMDRNQQQLEKKVKRRKDCRTMEYLELKYETDIQRGLTLEKVRQKQRTHKVHKTKEKKRIWLMCLKQECQDPLFFFFLYLCAISILFSFTQRMQLLLGFSFLLFLFLKLGKTFRYSKALFKQKEMYRPKAVVLRANTFQSIPVNDLVKGDIVRLKRGEKVAFAVISLKPPYKEYKPGEAFAENTGRAIVTQQISPPFSTDVQEENTENIILQELFIHQGIYFQPDFFKKNRLEEEKNIMAVGFQDIYFPSTFQIEKFRTFMQKLKKTGVKWFFFTSLDREEAFYIGKQAGIVEEKREVVDKKQFLLLKNVALEKQLGSIHIYCQLSETEKSQVITKWNQYCQYRQKHLEKTEQKPGKILFMSGLNEKIRKKATEENTENCVYACCNGGKQISDIKFGKCWRNTMIQYLTGENIWRKIFRLSRKWETQILASLCIFMLLSILLSFAISGQGKMIPMVQMGSLFCVIYIIGKEIAQEVFRKWFLEKLNNN